ncbi:CheY-like protein [Aspergillus karnatakaensis]|uniref:response regulator n=1 Tax=Aspergillus karnatakaensis TaxID=1810916 RepID=UPI003CCCE5F3
MHMLIVEDNRVYQLLLQKVLKRFGCTSSIACNGQEALTYLSSPSERCMRPDIIFMDDQMPVLDGYKTRNIIRTQQPFISDPLIASTPIVLMKAHAMIGDTKMAADRGFDDILIKPIFFQRLKKLIIFWSQNRVGAGAGAGIGIAGGGKVVPLPPTAQWGPFPLRAFLGPKSLL